MQDALAHSEKINADLSSSMGAANRKIAEADFNLDSFEVFAAGYASGVNMLKEAGRQDWEVEQIKGGELLCWRLW